MTNELITSNKTNGFNNLNISAAITAIRDSARGVESSIALPPELYSSESWFNFEKEAIWDREWICVGHVSMVPNEGDYFSITVIDDPLLVVKGSDGKIRTLSAVCQHRGHVLGEETGNTKYFRCPFHSWAYNLTGELVAAPEMKAHVGFNELKANHSLPSLSTDTWNGFIFMSFSETPPELSGRLKRLTKEVENHQMTSLIATPTVDWSGNDWNWKFMHENAIEPYHTHYLHKGVHDFAPSKLATFADWIDDDDGAIYHPTGFNYLDGNFTPHFHSLFPAITTLTEAERRRVMFACVMPNLFFGAVPDGVMYYLILPQNANTFTIRVGFLYPQSTLELPTFEHTFPTVVAGLELFNGQDVVANLAAHKGLKSRFAKRGRYAPKEATLPQLNKWLLKRYEKYAEDIGIM
ncbi:aromatic ring-hydroxylating dioxygenase subunit alpha [Porticoccaceae bacterium]|nr:aromatic ring-hydroxylating dioxygenase subunit alpha [Porticoccaceae bacterium]